MWKLKSNMKYISIHYDHYISFACGTLRKTFLDENITPQRTSRWVKSEGTSMFNKSSILRFNLQYHNITSLTNLSRESLSLLVRHTN